MTNRLESLNSSKPGAAKPSLKFRPKAVERKSKAERDASVVKTEEPERHPTRTRGATRGGRGRGGRQMYAGTHVVSSGLFASGAVSSGGAKERSIGTVSPNPEFISRLKLKDQDSSKSESSSGYESEDDGTTRIDMNKEYRFADEETVLFPIRPERDEPKQEVKVFDKEESPVKVEPEFTKESTVDSENIETELQQILTTKANLENKIAQPVDILNLEESQKIFEDYKRIQNTLNEKFENDGDKFTIFQLPKILPNYEQPESKVKKEDESIPDSTDIKNDDDSIDPLTKIEPESKPVHGQIGSLNIHKSGKITINLGNAINLDVTEGVASHFLQELVTLQPKPPSEDEEMATEEGEKVEGTIHKIGEAHGKFIATVSI